MNQRYNNAVAALEEMDNLRQAGLPMTEASAIGAIQTQATLAVAEEQAKTNQHLEMGNLIAYAQLRRQKNRSSLAAEELIDRRMSSAYPEIREEFADEEDDL
jgi:hypothetical protein